jgi:tetratricopeptide (TPR) repeat protein
VLALNPNDAATYFGRGNGYYNKREYNRAIADYDQTIRLIPKIYPDVRQPRRSLLQQAGKKPRQFSNRDNVPGAAAEWSGVVPQME